MGKWWTIPWRNCQLWKTFTYGKTVWFLLHKRACLLLWTVILILDHTSFHEVYYYITALIIISAVHIVHVWLPFHSWWIFQKLNMNNMPLVAAHLCYYATSYHQPYQHNGQEKFLVVNDINTALYRFVCLVWYFFGNISVTSSIISFVAIDLYL
jgi:hypothetical protein